MRRLRVAGLAAAVLPLVGGCVIYSNEAGEKVSVRVSDQAVAASAPAEAVRAFAFDGAGLNVVVDSNGCTEAASFEVRIIDGDPAELTLVRISPDLCKALVPDGRPVSWTYQELGLEAGDAVRLINPLKVR